MSENLTIFKRPQIDWNMNYCCGCNSTNIGTPTDFDLLYESIELLKKSLMYVRDDELIDEINEFLKTF